MVGHWINLDFEFDASAAKSPPINPMGITAAQSNNVTPVPCNNVGHAAIIISILKNCSMKFCIA